MEISNLIVFLPLREVLRIEVIQNMNKGMTVVAACKEVGIARSSYYDIVKKNPEAIASMPGVPVKRRWWK